MQDDSWVGFIGVVIIGLAIWGAISLYQNTLQAKTEVFGDLSTTEDCRVKINLSDSEYVSAKGKFICTDNRTQSGKYMGGTCIKLELSSDGKCNTAYTYYRKSDVKCGDNELPTYNDMCACVYNYIRDSNNKCVAPTNYNF
jgi:hypothetical protein